MGKRKAVDAAPVARPPAQAVVPATQRRDPILVTAKRRERQAQQLREKQRLLNANFVEFLHANKDKAQTLEDACKEYLYHCDLIYAASTARAAGPDLASRRGGVLYVVGSGDNGQLGLGEELVECAKPRPVLVFGDLLVKAVACGGMHTLALTEDGGAWSWGVNDEGALGRVLPVDADSAGVANQTGWTPERITFPGNAVICALSGGDSHSAALATDGSVFAWGSFRDKSGCFGFAPGVRTQGTPAQVFKPASAGERVIALESGADHVLLLSADGTVRSFGCAEKGRLGRIADPAESDLTVGDAPASQRDVLMRRITTPTLIPGLAQVVSIAAGSYSCFAITRSGHVYVWGLNNYGQLAIPQAEVNVVYVPCRVPLLEGRQITSFASGEHHTLAITAAGSLLSFGRPTYGRLGRIGVNVASDDAVHEPGEVRGFAGDPVVCANAGNSVSVAVTASGAMYTWGDNNMGMLGKSAEDGNDEITPYRLTASKHFPAVGGIAACVSGQHVVWLAAPPAETGGPAKKQRGA